MEMMESVHISKGILNPVRLVCAYDKSTKLKVLCEVCTKAFGESFAGGWLESTGYTCKRELGVESEVPAEYLSGILLATPFKCTNFGIKNDPFKVFIRLPWILNPSKWVKEGNLFQIRASL